MGARKAFTLIELLVVISILVLLMAILLPTLEQARKQAKAIGCQANLRQWSTLYAAALAENHGCWPDRPPRPGDEYNWFWGWGWGWGWGVEWGAWGGWDLTTAQGRRQYDQVKGILCCPMATRPAGRPDEVWGPGGTFRAWGWQEREPYPRYPYGSYGTNPWAFWGWYGPGDELAFHAMNERHGAQVPMYLDSCYPWVDVHEMMPPPPCDAIPTGTTGPANGACINRHNGCVNSLFLDLSVRQVGLKEIWTLKWHRQFNTWGPWTKAGGVQPEDWPQWMRRFKDY
jgi:prepilin-type N-terminal cleavage/methylation domain-containing protein